MNAPAKTPVAMRHIESAALVDFAEIYERDVELVSVRLHCRDIVNAAVQTLLSCQGLQAQWIQGSTLDLIEPGLGRSRAVRDALNTLRTEIATPVEVLEELLGCGSCGVRIKVLDGPMCPRFHVDRVPCRMLRTYGGAGTEWIANGECDFAALANADPTPLLPGSSIRRLDAGAWSLLKGGKWHDGFAGVVHRSPATSEPRLLVSIDPVFTSS